MISWSAAFLFQMDQNKALIKNRLIAKMSTVNDILMFHETHGDENDLRARCPQVAESHWCAASQGPSRAVGGIMTLISRKWLDGCIPVATPVVEGRGASER